MQIIVMFPALCAIRFPFLRMDVVNAFTDLACQKTTGTEQLNCIYIHTKINKHKSKYISTKKTLSRDALRICASAEHLESAAANFFQPRRIRRREKLALTQS